MTSSRLSNIHLFFLRHKGKNCYLLFEVVPLEWRMWNQVIALNSFVSRDMQFHSLSDSYKGRIFPGDVSWFLSLFPLPPPSPSIYVVVVTVDTSVVDICISKFNLWNMLICAAEWDQSSGRVLPLRDDDSQSLIEGEWRKINTLRHYQVRIAFSLWLTILCVNFEPCC